MSAAPSSNQKITVKVTENVAKILRDKDKVIKLQAKRIEVLEREVDKLRKERDSLNTKVTLLSCKLQVTGSAANHAPKDTSEGSSSSSRGGSGEDCRVSAPSSTSATSSSSTTTRIVYGRQADKPTAIIGSPLLHSNGNERPHNDRTHVHNATNERPVVYSTGSLKLQRSCKRAAGSENALDDKLRVSRAWATAYELSQDLRDKQVQILERRYGGRARASNAACVIQHAFRQHCMTRNFERLRTQLGERRRRQFCRSDTVCADMVVTVGREAAVAAQKAVPCTQPNLRIHTSSSQSAVRTVRLMHKSYSLNLTPADKEPKRTIQRSAGMDLSTINEGGSAEKTCGEVARPRVGSEFNDSSASDSSQQGTPVESHIDLPSVNFEQLLESKETDILTDSFHTDSIARDGAGTRPVQNGLQCLHQPLRIPYVPPPHSSAANIEIRIEDADERCRNGTAGHSVGQWPCTQQQPPGDCLTKIYANTEVHLRKKKAPSPPPGEETPPADSEKLTSGTSPIWKRKGSEGGIVDDVKRMSNISEASEPDSIDSRVSGDGHGSYDGHGSLDERLSLDDLRLSSSPNSDTTSMNSDLSSTYNRILPSSDGSRKESQPPSLPPKLTDRQRKRMYRIGLNLFNKKPEKGIKYLFDKHFLDKSAKSVAKFLISRKGLSKQMIGEYLGNLQKPFNMEVLEYFTNTIDLAGLQIDVALRLFQTYFRMPGEAQKIERLMEAFAVRYCECNRDQAKQFRSSSSVFLLAFAIIMLNTDLHNKSIKAERRMKLADFIKNLRGLDDGEDMDADLLTGIYQRIQASEFKPGTDHVSQVMKVEEIIVGKIPLLSLPHRRLVCYCRLYEVNDPNKREKLGLHQREVFLFNDLIMITKTFSKKKTCSTYSYRQSFSLCGMQVYMFQTPHYQYGIRLTTNIDGKVLITFNARNEHDRSKFVEDLKEAILEINEMESLRIDEELQKQIVLQNPYNYNRHSKDSGVVVVTGDEMTDAEPSLNRLSAPECGGGRLKKNALSNSLIDLTESGMRRGSGGSLDSGMASTSSGSTGSREIPVANGNVPAAAATASGKMQMKPSGNSRFSLFGKKTKSAKSLSGLADNCSEA